MNFIRRALTIFFSLIVLFGSSQYNFDYGIKLGGANYLGDIGGLEQERRDFIMDMQLGKTSWIVGGYARYKFSRSIGGNLSVNYGNIQGDDALSTNMARNSRNLRFKNKILEISARAEYYIFEANDVGGRGRYWLDLKTFAHFGISGFNHNPKGSFDGSSWTALQPLQTEEVFYSKWQIGVPVGVGMFFTFKNKHRIGWDVTWTVTFTDYLDDISTEFKQNPFDGNIGNQSGLSNAEQDVLGSFNVGQKRGDPTNNDTYMFTTFSYGRLIRSSNNFYKRSYGWVGGKRGKRRKVRAKF